MSMPPFPQFSNGLWKTTGTNAARS